MICEPSVGCSLCRDLLFGDVGIRPPVVFVYWYSYLDMCAKHLSSQDHFHQDFEFINFWCLHSCQSSMYSLPSSFHWQEQGGDWRGKTGTFVACDAPFSCLWWVKGNINAFQSGSLSFARMSCTATPFRFEVWGTGQAGYCLRLITERGVGGWVGSRTQYCSQNFSRSHISPPVSTTTHIRCNPIHCSIFKAFEFWRPYFPVLALTVHHHPIFIPSRRVSAPNIWLFVNFGAASEQQPPRPPSLPDWRQEPVLLLLRSRWWATLGAPPLAPSLDLSLLSCNGCYLSISSANFAQAIFHLVFAPKTTQALHQRVNKISACSSLVFHFMLFLHCSHKLHWGVRNLVAVAGAWGMIANLRVEKYQRDGRYENCRCL